MSLPPKICWYEGLGLSPQQFQQQDRYHEARLQRVAAAIHPHLWGVCSVTWNTEAMLKNSLEATAMSLIFQDGEVYEASRTERLPPPLDLSTLPVGEHHFTFYAALAHMNSFGDNLTDLKAQSETRYTRHDRDTDDLYSEAISTPVTYLQKNLRLLSAAQSRDAYVSFPVVRIRRLANGGFEPDPAFVPPSLATGASESLHGLLEDLLNQLHVKIETIYSRHRQSSKDVFEIQSGDITSYLMLNTILTAGATLGHSIRYRMHHPEFVFDKLCSLAGAMLAFSRRYTLASFPAYDHADAGPGFRALVDIVRDLIEVSISNKYHLIALVRDKVLTTRYDAVLDPAIVDRQTLVGLSVSADLPALELVPAVLQRFKIGSPKHIDNLVELALAGVKLNHMAQVSATIPVRPNTHYFSLEGKGSMYDGLLDAKALTVYAPSEIPGLKIELFAYGP